MHIAVKKADQLQSEQLVPSSHVEKVTHGQQNPRSLWHQLLLAVAFTTLLIALTATWLRIHGMPLRSTVAIESITHDVGSLYIAPIPSSSLRWFSAKTDSVEDNFASALLLKEDGINVGSAHTPHDTIRNSGKGLFSHWSGNLFFSTSDNSDPRSNGRTYSTETVQRLSGKIFWASWGAFAFVFLPLLIGWSRAFFSLIKRNLTLKQLCHLLGQCFLVTCLATLAFNLFGIPRTLVLDPDRIIHAEKNRYHIALSDYVWRGAPFESDTEGQLPTSQSRLFEDGKELGPPHTEHRVIAEYGKGRFSHWNDTLYFSSSDGTDPSTNHRVYRLKLSAFPLAGIVQILAAISLVLAFLAAPISRTRAAALLFSFATAVAVVLLLPHSSGILFWLGCGLIAISAWTAFSIAFENLFSLQSHQRFYKFWNEIKLGLPLLVLVISLVLAGGEFYLKLRFPQTQRATTTADNSAPKEKIQEAQPTIGEAAQPSAATSTAPKGDQSSYVEISDPILKTTLRIQEAALANVQHRKEVLVMPQSWERREVVVPGASHAFVWHEVVHVHDQNEFRRSTPFPDKDPKKGRIVVFGDSFTYGYGVDERFIYTKVLEDSLSEDFNIEVLNLGHSGFQSTDILGNMKTFVPSLAPDLIIYGMCLNDLLPSGVMQRQPYIFPQYPFLTRNTLLFPQMNHELTELLMSTGVRFDFYGEIGDNLNDYSARFSRDVKEMNEIALRAKLPPIVSIVFDLQPGKGGPGEKFDEISERLMIEAGLNVVSTKALMERFDQQSIAVSPWESHPNEFTHAVYAALLRDRLLSSGLLESFRRSNHSRPKS